MQPLDGQHVTLTDNELFAIMPTKALQTAKRKGRCKFCDTTWEMVDRNEPTNSGFNSGIIHLRDIHEGAEMWVLDDPKLPLVVRMQDNPVEIDWQISL